MNWYESQLPLMTRRACALTTDVATPPAAYYGREPLTTPVTKRSVRCSALSAERGGRLLRLSPTGEVLQEICLPVRCPTMIAFGGEDLKTLFITTVRHKRPAEELAQHPLSGCVLTLRVDVPGSIEPAYIP